jgi:hypothetical protein
MKKLTALFACAMLPLFMLLSVQAQGANGKPDIAGTFNTAALRQVSALSCGAQESMRQKNILPDYFPGTPSGFVANGALVVYSPHFNGGQRQRAEKLFASVPDHVRAIAYRGGATYVFPRKGIVEAVPALTVDPSYFGDSGLYMAVARRLYIPFERGEGLTKQPDGTYKARRFVASQREPFRIVNHESGHMVDDMMGDYSLDALGDDGDRRLSNRPDFRHALESDLRRLTAKNSPVPRSEVQRLGYYLPVAFEGRHIGGLRDTPDRARREVFAELWAEAQGYNSNRLSSAYPEAYKVVVEINAFLKDLHDSSPVQCTYTPDGHAVPRPAPQP